MARRLLCIKSSYRYNVVMGHVYEGGAELKCPCQQQKQVLVEICDGKGGFKGQLICTHCKTTVTPEGSRFAPRRFFVELPDLPPEQEDTPTFEEFCDGQKIPA